MKARGSWLGLSGSFGVALLLVMLCALPAILFAQPAARPGPFAEAASPAARPTADPAMLDYRLRARAVAEGVYVVEGANADFSVANGCNIINTGFITTGAGVIVINTGPSRRYGEQLRALIERTTREPLLRVVHLNMHPDYFLGNQAFADLPRYATPATRAGMAREGKAYEDNLYRLCGDWMKGTESLLPTHDAVPGRERIGRHELEWHAFNGHTESDLVLLDRTRGVLFSGGLVFVQRVPTTPHAALPAWQDSLRGVQALDFATLVPSHGPVRADRAGIGMTQRYLAWLDQSFREAAQRGDDMTDVLHASVPAEFAAWAAFRTEYVRNVANLYPRYEQAVLAQKR